MVERIRRLFFNDGPLVVKSVDFGQCDKSIEKDRKEQHASFLEETGSVIRSTVENTSNNQSHYDLTDNGRDRACFIAPQPLNCSLHTISNLHTTRYEYFFEVGDL